MGHYHYTITSYLLNLNSVKTLKTPSQQNSEKWTLSSRAHDRAFLSYSQYLPTSSQAWATFSPSKVQYYGAEKKPGNHMSERNRLAHFDRQSAYKLTRLHRYTLGLQHRFSLVHRAEIW